MEGQTAFLKIYHHKTWTGTHYWNLTKDEVIWMATPTGPQRVVKPGIRVVFNRGTYQCKDPQIAQMIEESREFKQGIVMLLPTPQEFAHKTKAPQMAAAPVQGQGASDLDRLINAAEQVAGALTKAIEARVGGAVQTSQVTEPVAEATPDHQPAQAPILHPASEHSPIPVGTVIRMDGRLMRLCEDGEWKPQPESHIGVPPQTTPAPQSFPASGLVDGELPDVVGRVGGYAVGAEGPAGNDTAGGPKTPPHVETDPIASPPNPKQFGDGYMKPTLAQQLAATHIDGAAEERFKTTDQFTPPSPFEELGLTPIPDSGQYGGASINEVIDQSSVLEELPPLAEEDDYVDPASIREMGKVLKDNDPRPSVDPKTGKRLIWCRFCDFHCSGGRAMSTHLQETHPLEYADEQRRRAKKKR